MPYAPAMRRRFSLLFLLLILLPAAAGAEFPKPSGFVNDFAGVLSSSTKTRMEATLASFREQSGHEIAVVTLPSLEGRPVEEVAADLFKTWRIGTKGKDDGLLFLVAPADRRMRIEVGYGLEGTINDALAGRLLDEEVLPRFRAGNLEGGIAAGTAAILKTIVRKEGLSFDADAAAGTLGIDAGPQPALEKKSGPLTMIAKIFLVLLLAILFIRHPSLFFFALAMLSSGGGRGGGGFRGGFGGFGGGSSGGGGASRGW